MEWSVFAEPMRSKKCKVFFFVVVLVLALACMFRLEKSDWVAVRDSVDRRLTHVFMCFTPKQTRQLRESLRSWTMFVPCSTWLLDRPKLVFLVNGKAPLEKSLRGDIMLFFSSLLSSRECFGEVEWMELLLSPQDDVHPKAPRLVFEHILRLGEEKTFGYVMLMEPDVRPIKSNWLENLLLLCAWPQSQFWIKGSAYRGTYHIPLHVNGAALYNIADMRFRDFYFMRVRKFVEKFGKSHTAYDADIFRYVLSHVKESQSIMHLIQFSEFVQNYGKSVFSRRTVLANSAETYLIHRQWS